MPPIHAARRVRSFAAGETLVREGEPSALLGIVVEGVLRVIGALPDGRHRVLGLHLPGAVFGHPFLKVPRYGIEAATAVRACVIDRVAFEAMLQTDPGLQRGYLFAILDEANGTRDLVAMLGSLRASERIARFLLAHCMLRAGGAVARARLPIGRRDIAALLGTTPETISRFFQEMVRRRVLRIRDARTFLVLDMPGLETVAGLAAGDGDAQAACCVRVHALEDGPGAVPPVPNGFHRPIVDARQMSVGAAIG